jgi:anti-anti-sigma factor
VADTRDLAGALTQAIAERPATIVVVDLGRVRFIDSVGLGVLVRGVHQARRGGVVFTVVRPSPMVARQMSVTGLSGYLSG